jgi:hypothetical protein
VRTVGAPPLRARAEDLLAAPASRAALALAFPVSRATAAEVLAGGTSFYPPMLDDIASATSSDKGSRDHYRRLEAAGVEVAAQFEAHFSVPAEEVSTPGRAVSGLKERVISTAFATISPLL